MAVNNPNDALWLGVVSTVVFITYLYNQRRTWYWWRKSRSYSSIRAFFVASMLQIGLARIVISSWLRAFPDTQWLLFLQSITAPILTVFLLTGGIVLFVAWKLDDRYEALKNKVNGTTPPA